MSPELAQQIALGYAALVGSLSLTAFVAYAIDKRRAKNGGRRIPERTLHRLAWLGGAPGGWAGRQVLRHKSRKKAFAVQLGLASLVHLAVAGALVWFATG